MNANISTVCNTLSDGSSTYDVAVDGEIVHYAIDEDEAARVRAALEYLDEHLNNSHLHALALLARFDNSAVRPATLN